MPSAPADGRSSPNGTGVAELGCLSSSGPVIRVAAEYLAAGLAADGTDAADSGNIERVNATTNGRWNTGSLVDGQPGARSCAWPADRLGGLVHIPAHGFPGPITGRSGDVPVDWSRTGFTSAVPGVGYAIEGSLSFGSVSNPVTVASQIDVADDGARRNHPGLRGMSKQRLQPHGIGAAGASPVGACPTGGASLQTAFSLADATHSSNFEALTTICDGTFAADLA